MKIACLDLEGVLVPEIWINVAERTGIPELRRTTRDEPDYDVLMKQRIAILERHALGLPDIQRVIAGMAPLPGAAEFLGWLRERLSVVILSDTFAEFAAPLMRQLGHPTLLCHNLEVDDRGRIVGYRIRLPDQKRQAVKAFHQLNLRGDRGGRLVQRHGDARGSGRRHPVPSSRQRRRGVPAVPRDARLRRAAPRLPGGGSRLRGARGASRRRGSRRA